MTQSSEYPDLKWVPAGAYGRGRDGRGVRYIVIHYTAGSERSTSAEDGAAYDQRRTDGISTHYFVDQNSVVQCVLTSNRANAARHKGNRLGIQYELCGTVQTREQWLDTASANTLKLAARQVARDCKKYGIPVRRLSVAETRQAWADYPNGPKGIVGHVDCTYAYPEDGGDHTDPGSQFPWDVFLGMVRNFTEETTMATQFNPDDKAELYAAAKKIAITAPQASGGGLRSDVGEGVWHHGFERSADSPTRTSAWSNVQAIYDEVQELKAAVAALGVTLTRMSDQLDTLTANPTPPVS